MKKNRIRQTDIPHSTNNRQEEIPAVNIPVLLMIGFLLLALDILPFLLHTYLKPTSIKNSGQYLSIIESLTKQDGIYFLTPDELRQSFPELLPLIPKTSPDSQNDAVVTTVHYRSGSPEIAKPNPLISNIFFLPIPINRAEKEVLNTLPGIGPVLAERIIQRRITAGPFRSKNELLQIAGIGPGKLDRLKDHILID